jgi:hypothetical protein
MNDRPTGDAEPGAGAGLRLRPPAWAAELEDAQRRAAVRRRELESRRRERLRLEVVVIAWLRSLDGRR